MQNCPMSSWRIQLICTCNYVDNNSNAKYKCWSSSPSIWSAPCAQDTYTITGVLRHINMCQTYVSDLVENHAKWIVDWLSSRNLVQMQPLISAPVYIYQERSIDCIHIMYLQHQILHEVSGLSNRHGADSWYGNWNPSRDRVEVGPALDNRLCKCSDAVAHQNDLWCVKWRKHTTTQMVCLDWKTVRLAPIEKCNTVESNSLDFHLRRPGAAGAENITKLGSLIFKIMCVAFSCALRIECNSQMWNWAIYEKCFHLWCIVNHADSHHGRTPQAILAGGWPTWMICAFMIQPNPIIHIYNAWPADCCLCYQSGPASNHDLLLWVSFGFFRLAVVLVHQLAQIHCLLHTPSHLAHPPVEASDRGNVDRGSWLYLFSTRPWLLWLKWHILTNGNNNNNI